jgi:hypothetical protein
MENLCSSEALFIQLFNLLGGGKKNENNANA